MPGAGRFYEPTVLVDVDHTMKIMTEETFGPTLPIMKVADAEEAVRLANDSPYGLGSSVFTRDTARGEAIARRIEAGAANVNDAMINYTVLELPMGGAKASGLGSRHGAGGIRKYCSQQAIVVTRLAMKKELFMYPYKPRTSRLLAGLFKLLYGRGKRGLGRIGVRRTLVERRRPSRRSSSGDRASRRWCGAPSAMPSSCAGVRLKGRSSTYTHSSAGTPARSAPSSYIRRDRLADALLAGDDDAVEELANSSWG